MDKAVTLKVRPRSRSACKTKQAFQADVEPIDVIGGEELYRRFAEFCGRSPDDAAKAKMQIQMLEEFVKNELRRGNRVDFGLVSFYPRLSGAMPSVDADPAQEGLCVRAAVKARSGLVSAMDGFVVAKNDLAVESAAINSVTGEGDGKLPCDRVKGGDVWRVIGKDIEVDASASDEGVWLETRKHKRFRKPETVARGTVLESSPIRMRCRFAADVKPGEYILAVGTRSGRGKKYRLRIVRHLIRVVN